MRGCTCLRVFGCPQMGFPDDAPVAQIAATKQRFVDFLATDACGTLVTMLERETVSGLVWEKACSVSLACAMHSCRMTPPVLLKLTAHVHPLPRR